MDEALSLKNGKFIAATDANHSTCKTFLVVCPECGEPLYFKYRTDPNNKPFFSHYKETISPTVNAKCSLRVDGSSQKRASSIIKGLKQGQLVDKFQREFCLELNKILNLKKNALMNFINLSRFEPLPSSHYKLMFDYSYKNLGFSSIVTTQIPIDIDKNLSEGLNEVLIFIKSSYGTLAGNFVYQTAYFVAIIVKNPDVYLKSTKTTNRKILFDVDSERLQKYKKYASEILPKNNKRNIMIPKVISYLLKLILLSWRHPNYAPTPFAIVNRQEGEGKTLASGISRLKQKKIDVQFDSPKTEVVPTIRGIRYFEKSGAGSNLTIAQPKNNSEWSEWGEIHEKTSSESKTVEWDRWSEIHNINKPASNKKAEPINYSSFPRISTNLNLKRPQIPASQVSAKPTFKYDISNQDILRIHELTTQLKNLSSKRLVNQSREGILEWAKTKNIFEAFFLANLAGVVDEPLQMGGDYTVQSKLEEYLKIATRGQG